jgi:hypothetical protein
MPRFAKSWRTSAPMRSVVEEVMRSSTVNISSIRIRKTAAFRNHHLTRPLCRSLSQKGFSIGNLYKKEQH